MSLGHRKGYQALLTMLIVAVYRKGVEVLESRWYHNYGALLTWFSRFLDFYRWQRCAIISAEGLISKVTETEVF